MGPKITNLSDQILATTDNKTKLELWCFKQESRRFGLFIFILTVFAIALYLEDITYTALQKSFYYLPEV